MQRKICDLPEISFVGGETRQFRFPLRDKKGRVFDVSGATANFSVVGAMNRSGAPIVSKPMDLVADENGITSVLTVTLHPAETVNLYGKYIYQISICDVYGDIEIPSQGVLFITNNIDRSFIH